MDARLCLSYDTIERPSHSTALASQMNGWIFGCDICQEVCPWNRKSQLTDDVAWKPSTDFQRLDLIEVLQLTEKDFADRFHHTPLWRSRRRGLLRNAILLAGSQRLQSALPTLRKLAQSDSDALVRAASVWALGQMQPYQSLSELVKLTSDEQDQLVRSAIAEVLGNQDSDPEH
jgi:epoxyqueuosine reductase